MCGGGVDEVVFQFCVFRWTTFPSRFMYLTVSTLMNDILIGMVIRFDDTERQVTSIETWEQFSPHKHQTTSSPQPPDHLLPRKLPCHNPLRKLLDMPILTTPLAILGTNLPALAQVDAHVEELLEAPFLRDPLGGLAGACLKDRQYMILE